MKNIIVCDLDGTLLDDQKTISDQNISALQLYDALIIASGRHFRDIKPFLSVFKSSLKYVISCDGCYIHDLNGKVLSANGFINFNDVKYIQRTIKSKQMHLICSDKDYILTDNIFVKLKMLIHRQNFITNKKTLEKIKIEKIRIPIDYVSSNQIEQLQKEYSVHICFGAYLDINAKNVNKYEAILKICEINDYLIDDVVYFGDDMNDIECFENLPNCVAMENACSEIIKRAKYVTKSNNNDGVSYALYRYFNE